MSGQVQGNAAEALRLRRVPRSQNSPHTSCLVFSLCEQIFDYKILCSRGREGRRSLSLQTEIFLLDYGGSTQNPEAGANQPLTPSFQLPPCPHLQDKQSCPATWPPPTTRQGLSTGTDLQPSSAALAGVCPTVPPSAPAGLGLPVLSPSLSLRPHCLSCCNQLFLLQ